LANSVKVSEIKKYLKIMFGLDTIFLLGVWALTGTAAAAANNNRDNNNRNEWRETLHRETLHHAPIYSAGSSSSTSSGVSSSVHTNHDYFEKRTIWDWWCNGLTGDERKILLENGYADRSGCFSLEELKSTSERMHAEKAPGKPTEKDGFEPDKKKGGKLVDNPNGQGKGWLDEKGEVWVPTGESGHGGPHWDVQNPRTGGHRNVYFLNG